MLLGMPGGPSSQADSAVSRASLGATVPLRDAAAPLRDVWLRFHESDLCLNIDSVFVFHARGLEIWCRVKDDRGYQELTAFVEPLQKSYRIDLYATRADREKKPWAREDDDPPPSLWNNAELRLYFRDPLDNRLGTSNESEDGVSAPRNADPELKRRIKLYSDQIAEWTGKIDRLSHDLAALAGAGYGADIVADSKARARAVCLDHVREIGKCAGKLVENLRHAFPRGKAETASPQSAKKAAEISAYDSALNVVSEAHGFTDRMLRFLYPQSHTVSLADLREPRLIDLLKTLQQAVADFERSAQRAR